VIDQGIFPIVPPFHGAVAQFTLPPTIIGGTPVVTFPDGFNPCDALLGLDVKAVSSTGPTLPPVIETQLVDANFEIFDLNGRWGECPDTNVKRTNPNAFLTPGEIAVTPATNIVAAVHDTDIVAHTYCLRLHATDDGHVTDQKCTTINGGETDILTFGPPFPSVGSVVPVVCAGRNPVSVTLDILQTVVTTGGHTEIRSQQISDSSLNSNTLDSALTPQEWRCD
jgi:hypothetical protein